MLLNLNIRNIAIADNIDIDWSGGMTSISGETGAGKSILLNSLNLALGERADSGIVRHGEKRAEVIATFQISRIPGAVKWLKERDLDQGDECILRRTITSEGRSRAFINGQPVPLTELKTIGELLIDIHSQHAHQSLLRTDTHLRLLDEYAGLNAEKKSVREKWLYWQGLERKFNQLKQAADERDARKQLLEYQCEELQNLALEPGEVESLEAEFKRMNKSDSLLKGAHQSLSVMDNDDEYSVIDLLKQAMNNLNALDDNAQSLDSAKSLIEGSLIQAEEAINDLHHYIDSFEANDERRVYVEERLNTIHDLARKHAIPSEQLQEHSLTLETELQDLADSETELATIEEELLTRKTDFFNQAQKLSKKRLKAKPLFENEILEKLNQLAMPAARFDVVFSQGEKPSADGLDAVEFQISLNPGQPLQALARVASGGELSRISLAIQVVCAEHSTIPTLVFDEVDVGVSGATAEIVGHMLRSVGSKGQVICVTHLPQVAAQGHNHCIVKKEQTQYSTTTHIRTITQEQRIDELARMLGGIDITAQTRAHAEEMLRSHLHAH